MAQTTTTALSTRALVASAAVAAVAAAAVNSGLRLLALETTEVGPEFDPLVDPAPVIIFTVVGVAIGAVLRRVLEGRTANPERGFVRLTIILALLSLAPNVAFGIAPDAAPTPGGGPGPQAWLGAMHLVAAAIAIPLLARAPIGRQR